MPDVNDWVLIRKALIDELEAVNYYEDFMLRLESQEAVQVMDHINVEEKEHVAELTELLRRLDPVQAQKLEEELHHSQHIPSKTVGSLKEGEQP